MHEIKVVMAKILHRFSIQTVICFSAAALSFRSLLRDAYNVTHFVYEKLSCRRDTARRSVALFGARPFWG